MKIVDDNELSVVRKLEAQGDSLVEKEQFETCLSAIDFYLKAQAELYRAVNDDSIENAKPYPAFNSDNVSYNAWYNSLNIKLVNAQLLLANPQMAHK